MNEKICYNNDRLKAKLEILADAAKYDASCSSSGSQRKRHPQGMGNVEGMGICHSYTPDGRCISLLKILLTNYCIYDCKYCVNRITSDVKRAKFTVDEVVWLTLNFYRRNYIEGLFLSSGIFESSDATMMQLIEVAKKLREYHKFNGYIHLKIVAGASEELTLEAGKWADRVSANIEMPVQSDLNLLAPAKTIESATTSMRQIENKINENKSDKKNPLLPSARKQKFAPAGQTTQMIVGATETSDKSILITTEKLYTKYQLRRVYYSAYSPIPHANALLPAVKPPLLREHRLYQADWLLRFYNFKADELLSEDHPYLDLKFDPKTAWALQNRDFFPIDLNKGDRFQLLRVPGLGVRNVERILQLRKFKRIVLDDLKKLRVSLNRAKYFILTSDYNPNSLQIDSSQLGYFLRPQQEQLSLFEATSTSQTGEL